MEVRQGGAGLSNMMQNTVLISAALLGVGGGKGLLEELKERLVCLGFLTGQTAKLEDGIVAMSRING